MADTRVFRGGGEPLNDVSGTSNVNISSSSGGLGYTGNSDMDAGAALLVDFYTRVYPTVDELSMDLNELAEGELVDIVAELRTEAEALREETGMFEYNVSRLHPSRTANATTTTNSGYKNATSGSRVGGGGGGGNVGDGSAVGALLAGTTASGGNNSHQNNTVTRLMSAEGSTASLMQESGGDGVAGSTTAMRRGRGYRRKSQEDADVFVSVTDKMSMLVKEGERLQQQEERASRQAAQVKDVLTATVEESQRRLKELQLEFRQFCREVFKRDGRGDGNGAPASRSGKQGTTTAATADPDTVQLPDGTLVAPGSACADDLLVYMRRRVQSQNGYLDKLAVQCSAAEQDISRAQQQLRQRKAAGEAFNAVDFAQLRIENEQSNERIDKKNAELADLKGTSTRAVQTLNSLMDALNELNAEQAQLKKELRSRGEYLARCSKEVTVVASEAAGAEKKNETIKAQHEAVKVPKIEEYIAQTAELFELQKALKNWSRKVEIAEGQVKVLRQQTRKLHEQRDAAVAYAEAKRKKRQAAILSSSRRTTAASSGLATGFPSSAAAAASAAPRTAAPSSRTASVHHGPPPPHPRREGSGAGGPISGVMVGGAKSLLQPARAQGNVAPQPAPSKAQEAAPAEAAPASSGGGEAVAVVTRGDAVDEAAERVLADAEAHVRAVAPTEAPASPSRQEWTPASSNEGETA